ncbi:MAG: tryptophan 2,3-dioxygenase family protein [Acidimicrobiia bacterium]|nr:tryptophan 2,3-dioxygenase family protein [Acidimicrobiia bacterium]
MSEITYGTYLKVDELLSLQQPLSRPVEHDEMLFIIIHQVYELWFKEVLHELDEMIDYLEADRPALSSRHLDRVLTIFKTLVAQIDVLETMTPLEFDSFRDFLATGSGFQSAQFRELEFVLGVKSPAHLHRFADNEREFANLERRYNAPSIWDAFIAYVGRQGYDVPDAFLQRDVTEPTPESPEIQAALIEIYRHDPALTQLCEALTDLDEGLHEWRFRHVMMVQRTIGAKMGTGGSTGAEYLRSTLFRPAFPDLWAIRSAF